MSADSITIPLDDPRYVECDALFRSLIPKIRLRGEPLGC